MNYIHLGGLLTKGLAYSLLIYFMSYQIRKIFPKEDEDSKKKAKDLLKKFGLSSDRLTDHEIIISSQLVDPSDIDVTFDSICGLDDTIQKIKTNLINFLSAPNLYKKCPLIKPPKGILFYGPPGCGKTMLVKAIVKESNYNLLNINLSTITSKWYGESQKRVQSIFSFAEKISPCIIFIDEIDMLLSKKSENEHDTSSSIKSLFLQNWDGLLTNQNKKVILIGATNNKNYIDPSFISRLSMTIMVPLPNFEMRKKILQSILKKTDCQKNVNIDIIANKTENFSGRDLTELCRAASAKRFEDIFKKNQSDNQKIDSEKNWRKIEMSDFDLK